MEHTRLSRRYFLMHSRLGFRSVEFEICRRRIISIAEISPPENILGEALLLSPEHVCIAWGWDSNAAALSLWYVVAGEDVVEMSEAPSSTWRYLPRPGVLECVYRPLRSAYCTSYVAAHSSKPGCLQYHIVRKSSRRSRTIWLNSDLLLLNR